MARLRILLRNRWDLNASVWVGKLTLNVSNFCSKSRCYENIPRVKVAVNEVLRMEMDKTLSNLFHDSQFLIICQEVDHVLQFPLLAVL